MFWFNNDRTGRYKVIKKIERIILSLVANSNQIANDFIIKFRVCDIWKVFNQQSLSFMYMMYGITVCFILI